MEITQLLGPDCVVCGMDVADKKQAIRGIADAAAPFLNIDSHLVYDALLHRERLGTTGLGGGIAIPHARLEGVNEMKGFLVKLKTPVDFEAVDDTPVDLLFALFAPAEAGSDHLNALVVASRLLRDPFLTGQLRATHDTATFYAVATRPADQKNAA